MRTIVRANSVGIKVDLHILILKNKTCVCKFIESGEEFKINKSTCLFIHFFLRIRNILKYFLTCDKKIN